MKASIQTASVATTAEAIPLPPPVLATSVADISATVLIVGGCLTVASFLAKWAFEQIVGNWAKRLESAEAKISVQSKEVAELSAAAEHLAKTAEELSSQVRNLAEGQRTIALFNERQNMFDQRLQNYGGALQDLQRLYQESQKESVMLRAELATNYLRREDWTRFSNTVDAKLDAVARKVEDQKELFLDALRVKRND